MKLIRRFKIAGDSMVPSLRPHDVVWAVRMPHCLLRSGQIVVVQIPHGPLIIKRIEATLGNGMLVLRSDNASADIGVTTSHWLGAPISTQYLVGVVLWNAGPSTP